MTNTLVCRTDTVPWGALYSTGAAIWRFGTKLVYYPGEQPEWGGRPSGPDLPAADTESR